MKKLVKWKEEESTSTLKKLIFHCLIMGFLWFPFDISLPGAQPREPGPQAANRAAEGWRESRVEEGSLGSAIYIEYRIESNWYVFIWGQM